MKNNILITEVSVQKNNPQRVNVYSEDGFLFSLDDAYALSRGIKAGRVLTPKETENLIMESQFSKARSKALDILSRKNITRHDLEKKLKEDYDVSVVTQVIEEMEELGYIDDYAYTLLFLESAVSKLWGRKKIEYELSLKGVDRNTIEDAMAEYTLPSAEEIAEYIAVKYPDEDMGDRRTYQRVMRFFMSRGFDCSEISDAIKIFNNTQKE